MNTKHQVFFQKKEVNTTKLAEKLSQGLKDLVLDVAATALVYRRALYQTRIIGKYEEEIETRINEPVYIPFFSIEKYRNRFISTFELLILRNATISIQFKKSHVIAVPRVEINYMKTILTYMYVANAQQTYTLPPENLASYMFLVLNPNIAKVLAEYVEQKSGFLNERFRVKLEAYLLIEEKLKRKDLMKLNPLVKYESVKTSIKIYIGNQNLNFIGATYERYASIVPKKLRDELYGYVNYHFGLRKDGNYGYFTVNSIGGTAILLNLVPSEEVRKTIHLLGVLSKATRKGCSVLQVYHSTW